jgi:hypothetical protein
MSKERVYTKAQIEKIKKTNLHEAPISYDGPERMDPTLQGKIESGEFPGAKLPAYPKVPEEGVHNTFEELVASDRFKEVVDNVKRYTGLQQINMQGMMQLQMLLMQSVQQILSIESEHKEELEELAVKIVKEEMAIPDDALQFDAKIVGMGEIDMEGMQGGGDEPEEEEMDAEEEAFEEFEDFDIEKQKRRFLNQLIQGASKKGHYLFHMVEQELNHINPNLINLYGIMMSINDLVYWIMPDQTTMMMAESGESIAGKEEIDPDTDPPTVIARGITFPVLVHELIKGVMEVFATQGLPDDEKQARKVMDSEDTLVGEVWDLRLGPIIWEKFRNAYPMELMQDDKTEIQNYLFAEFASMEAKDMFRLAKDILGGTDRGKEQLEKIVKDIIDQISKEDYEESLPTDYGDTGDDDITTLEPEGEGPSGSFDIPQESQPEEMSVDVILDKIGKSGMSSLSKDELAFLRRQS